MTTTWNALPALLRCSVSSTDDVIEALQGSHRARVVTLSATSFKPGFRADLDRLGAACRNAGVRLVVDGAQSIGITHLDLARTPIDAFAVSTQKGLCSLYGMGFLYVRREFAESLAPRYLARFGVDIDASHEADTARQSSTKRRHSASISAITTTWPRCWWATRWTCSTAWARRQSTHTSPGWPPSCRSA
ncbi:aminotransferase class V-fold PLP-dependent enzyme [Polaromonas hydrogenivorans]|uniref:aminotransferase class V-fold PLP-dependent enzyme n=1 Tax=Polaromonas hydrogenivorans TaxID=335476 RepID=UPI0039EF404C